MVKHMLYWYYEHLGPSDMLISVLPCDCNNLEIPIRGYELPNVSNFHLSNDVKTISGAESLHYLTASLFF